ncbi:response regulator [candidate division KSB1 bacterium]|nr:response regulator [candidate division KSB1 bacterium]
MHQVYAPKILLLGDEFFNNKILAKILQEMQFDVSTFPTASNGYLKRDFGNVDLMVVEIEDGNGKKDFGWIQQVKQQTPSTKVIVVNSGKSIETIIEAFQNGANDFFRKPVDEKLLSERILALLET